MLDPENLNLCIDDLYALCRTGRIERETTQTHSYMSSPLSVCYEMHRIQRKATHIETKESKKR